MSEIVTMEQAQEIIDRAIAEHNAPPPTPPAPAASEPADKPYDPFDGADPTIEQAAGLSEAEKAQLSEIRPGWDERVATHTTEADRRKAWAEAQAAGERERSQAAAQAGWDEKVRTDPKYRQLAHGLLVGRDAATRWTALTDQQRVEAVSQSGLLQRQRGIVGDELVGQIRQRTGFTAEQLSHAAQLEQRLVRCPDPRAWGAGVVQVAGQSGEPEPHVLMPAGGFTPDQEVILGLRKHGEQSLSAS